MCARVGPGLLGRVKSPLVCSRSRDWAHSAARVAFLVVFAIFTWFWGCAKGIWWTGFMCRLFLNLKANIQDPWSRTSSLEHLSVCDGNQQRRAQSGRWFCLDGKGWSGADGDSGGRLTHPSCLLRLFLIQGPYNMSREKSGLRTVQRDVVRC